MKYKFIALLCLLMLFCLAANAQSGRKSNQPNEPQNQTEEKRENKNEENRPVNIFRRPKPDVDIFGRCFRNEGFSYVKTVLRVTLDASAKITDVKVVTLSGCQEFDEESVDAVRRIKFEPAIQDGKPITVTKTVIYEGGVR